VLFRSVLVIQWDGYVVNPAAWTDAFLQYDYIGAPWGFHNDAHRVGNGGFSLRSSRLLRALSDPDISETDPEDEMICRRYRPLLEERYGIRFAPEALAARFSFETTYFEDQPFGFHGLFNMWMVIPPEEFDGFLRSLTPDIMRSHQLLRLAINYRDLGRSREAVEILRRRLEFLPGDPESSGLLAALTRTETAPTRPASRNAPCPCGSGKRYKECCGSLSGAATPQPPADAEAMLQEAVRQHQGGNLFAAEALYDRVLSLDGTNPMALHYLGVVRMQQRRLSAFQPSRLLIRLAPC
jgi:tetratricopeptide (TPR) repeat protein